MMILKVLPNGIPDLAVLIGLVVGAADGDSKVGMRVLDTVGAMVGFLEGLRVGILVLATLGKVLGRCEGRVDGCKVGLIEGTKVGVALVHCVGLTVGLSVLVGVLELG